MKKIVDTKLSEAFAMRPYRVLTRSLAEDGVPWIPLVGMNSYLDNLAPGKSPLHRHDGCIEIIYSRRGICEYESGGEKLRLMPRQVFVSRPDEPHEMVSNPLKFSSYYLLFRVRGNRPWPADDKELQYVEKRLRSLPRVFDGGRNVSSCFARLVRLASQDMADATERRLRIRTACMNLLLEILDSSSKVHVSGMSGRIQALADEMRERPGNQYSIEDLAARIGFSSSSLLAGFKATVGFTPHAYLLKCRIEKAKELLQSGGMKITAISYELGFPSSQHFATQFRKATGFSPRQWAQGGCS